MVSGDRRAQDNERRATAPRPPTHRVAVSNAEDRDYFAGIAHGEEGAVVGIRHVGHGALGLQELALVPQRGAQDGVQADIPVLQEKRGAASHFPACTTAGAHASRHTHMRVRSRYTPCHLLAVSTVHSAEREELLRKVIKRLNARHPNSDSMCVRVQDSDFSHQGSS